MSALSLEAVTAWLRHRLVANWPTKVTALVLATVLWAVVEAQQPTTQLVPVRVELSAPAGWEVAEPLPPVQALYAGPASELIKLYATPPVIHRTVDEADTTVQLSLGDLVIARGIEASPQDVQPRSVPVRLERRATPPAGGDDTTTPPDPDGTLSERVLMGVPVELPSRLRDLDADPPAVVVTVRGPAGRLGRLTRDSVRVMIPNGAAVASQVLRLLVEAPAGLTAIALPESIQLVTTPRG